jgi:hypothetical protein
VGVDGCRHDAVAALADHLADLVPGRLAVLREEGRLVRALDAYEEAELVNPPIGTRIARRTNW